MESYKILSKLYYQDKEAYESVAQSRINGENTIFIPIDIKRNRAFFVPTLEMLNKIEVIFKNKSKIDKMEFELPSIAIESLIEKSLKDEIMLTNEIEGVSSTRREIEAAIRSQDSGKKARFKGLAAKYIKLIQDDEFLITSCHEIRKLYDDIVMDEIENDNAPDGKLFRKEQVAVVTPTQKEKHRGVMPEANIIACMESSLQFLNEADVNAIIRVSVFHYLFGYVHPFYDGNGRLSRFISSCILKKEIGVLLSLRLSYTIKNNIKKYYDAFDICNDEKNKGEVTYFILMFLDLLLEETTDLIAKLEELTSKLDYYRKVINANLLGEKKEGLLIFVLCQNALFGDSFLTVANLQKVLKQSSTTVRKLLMNISKIVDLETIHIGKKVGYSINLKSLESLNDKDGKS